MTTDESKEFRISDQDFRRSRVPESRDLQASEISVVVAHYATAELFFFELFLSVSEFNDLVIRFD